MTQDDLLKKIYSMELRYANEKPRREALRAVVELHKPLEQFHLWLDKSMIENSRKLPFMCKLCRVEYPCPTIQAIEKELA